MNHTMNVPTLARIVASENGWTDHKGTRSIVLSAAWGLGIPISESSTDVTDQEAAAIAQRIRRAANGVSA